MWYRLNLKQSLPHKVATEKLKFINYISKYNI